MKALLPLLLLFSLAHADIGELLAQASDAERPEAERMAAFDALVAEGYGPALIQLAEDQSLDARQRYVAVRALGRVDSPPGQEALIRLLADDISGIRAAAAAALGEAHHAEHALKIAALLEDPATIVRAAAADALVSLPEEAVIPYLERALWDPSNFYRGQSLWVRRHFVDALGATGGRAALPSLVRCLQDADSTVVESALAALEKVSGLSWADGRSRDEQIQAWQRWYANQR